MTVPGPVAYAVLGLSKRQFHRLVNAGVLPRAGKGKFDLYVIGPAFAQYLRDGREGSGDLVQEKLRLTVAQRREIELKTRIRSRELVEREDAERVYSATMVLIGSQLEGIGGRMAGELAAISDAAVIRKRLLDETRRIRTAAADQLEAWVNGPAGREPAAPATDEDA